MDKLFAPEFQAVSILIILGLIVLFIMMVVAVLKLPKIAKYQKAQLILLAYLAKNKGLSTDVLQSILNDADKSILQEQEIENIIV